MMVEKVVFTLDKDIYEKFCIALKLTGATQEDVVENFMLEYMTNQFSKVSQAYNPRTTANRNDNNKNFTAKAINKIPTWAHKSNQYNHKIIRAYFAAQDIAGEVTLNMMERLCSDKEYPESYVPTFKSNYAQMKMDGPKTHGKVFEDNGHQVWIWSEVEEVLMRYKNNFYQQEK